MIQIVQQAPTRVRRDDASPSYAPDLAERLQSRIDGEVRFDNGSRALYATDASNYRQPPIGVVIPRHAGDVIETLALCREFGAPVLSRGGGTSLAGQCCNFAVLMDFSKYMNKVVEVDRDARRARVQPGLVLDHLRKETERYDLTYGPDPATHSRCTFGGMIGNDSCGVHSVMAGRTDQNVEELEIVTYDGRRMRVGKDGVMEGDDGAGEMRSKLADLARRYDDLIRQRYPNIPRRVSGYNLPALLPENGFHIARSLVGTEGTCVTVLEATVRLIPWPKHRSLLVLGYPDVYAAGDHIPEVMEAGPMGLEGLDETLVKFMRRKHLHLRDLRLLPDGKGFLLVEFGGDNRDEADGKAHRLMEKLREKSDAPSMKLYDDREETEKVWEIRESGLGATAFVPGERDAWPGWEDSAVPPDRVGEYLRSLRELFNKYEYQGALYGHFGQGCIHTRITFDLATVEGIRKYRSFVHEAADLVVSFGGSLSGEHGDGQARGELLPKMYGPELVQAFREFKSIWDPDWRMNPGKVIDADAVDENLRIGADYNPPQPDTHFHYQEENGSFAKATLRCVGVGKCRRIEGGTMCPSYRVTREEQHSTRGRARLLFEMMQGEVIQDGWRSEAVNEALDLCLACKGCKSDCPVNVDMATYKAEFLSHYYEGRIRPRHAYAMGLIFRWARLASYAPWLANFFSQTPGFRVLAKAAAGMSQQREVPKFAPEPFTRWFRRREPRNLGAPDVILWPDTFNNYFHTDTAFATCEVLEDAGFHVIVPERPVCCGRPLYDYGMLDRAKRQLLDALEVLQPHIQRSVPMVGMEPSCTAVFRDEMTSLFPHITDAARLRDHTFTLGEFLHKNGYQPPPLHRKALLHGHCHHDAVMKLDGEKEMLRAMGLDLEKLDSGCCGMAGSFGFEEDHYQVSREIGELVLLPAVRKAADDTIIIADGFSCRTQIEQGSHRKAIHLAQAIRMAQRYGPEGPAGPMPERAAKEPAVDRKRGLTRIAIAAGTVAGLLCGWLLYRRSVKGRNRYEEAA